MKTRNNLCDEIVSDIKNSILVGIIKPGEKIPGEYELAEKYSVSRFAIREAMKKLDSMGLITIRHGVGSFVNELAPESFMKPLLPMLMLNDNDIERIFEARLPLEVQAIALCVERSTEEEKAEIGEKVRQMEQALLDNEFEKYNSLDVEYHLLIARASQNLIIYEVLRTLQDLLKVSMKRVFDAPESKERSIKRHRLMFDAIVNREKELAKQLMTLHINDSIEYLLKQ